MPAQHWFPPDLNDGPARMLCTSGGALCAFPQFLSLLIVQRLAGFILLHCRVETLEFIGLIKIEIPVLGLLGVAMFVQWGIYFFFF